MIELKNISLERNGKKIFDNFNLNVQPKERLVIVGASGVGKSTLLRLIAGLDVPDEGVICIEAQRVTQNHQILVEPHQRGVNMVFQDLALWRHLSVEGNIAFGLKVQKKPKAKIRQEVNDMLRLVGLEGYEHRAIESLSGGEQQRVALARALVTWPKILLMDEPLSSLDTPRREALNQEIVALHELLGFTLIYVTHAHHEVERIATRVLEIGFE